MFSKLGAWSPFLSWASAATAKKHNQSRGSKRTALLSRHERILAIVNASMHPEAETNALKKLKYCPARVSPTVDAAPTFARQQSGIKNHSGGLLVPVQSVET